MSLKKWLSARLSLRKTGPAQAAASLFVAPARELGRRLKLIRRGGGRRPETFGELARLWEIDGPADARRVMTELKLRLAAFATAGTVGGAALWAAGAPEGLPLAAAPALLGALTSVWRWSLLRGRRYRPLGAWLREKGGLRAPAAFGSLCLSCFGRGRDDWPADAWLATGRPEDGEREEGEREEGERAEDGREEDERAEGEREESERAEGERAEDEREEGERAEGEREEDGREEGEREEDGRAAAALRAPTAGWPRRPLDEPAEGFLADLCGTAASQALFEADRDLLDDQKTFGPTKNLKNAS
ncbi:MAG: hypothetical protein LBU12_05650 [Deltaproteobacteria bacterium]|jgi:hypothetical protein|nr:hypothetical protein [Deltaproteobacteria bacterium]